MSGPGFHRGREPRPAFRGTGREGDEPASDERPSEAPTALTDPRELIEFVHHEARLLDDRRFEEWLSLFAEDGHYWMPAEWGQTDPRLQSSLMYEDLLLLKIRVERLANARTFSQKPQSRSQHLLQTPQVDELDDERSVFRTYTPFHYAEVRLDEQTLFAGWARHTLVRQDGALRIRLKRLDLLNFDAPHGNIQLFM